MKILGTGLNGLVGSRITELLSSYEFENISRSTGVDITDKESVLRAFQESDASVVFHVAAKAHVDGCELDKAADLQTYRKDGIPIYQPALHTTASAWEVNVIGTYNIVNACEATEKSLVFISTDFVFDGEHAPQDGYTEDDIPGPINWYAQTKYEGEEIVKKAHIPWTIARIAYPYRSQFGKNDFIRAVLHRLEQHEQITMVTDHIMTPTFIDDIAGALDAVMQHKQTGILHVVGSEFISPYQAAKTIANVFGQDTSLIGETTREAYFAGKAPRPFQLPMNNDRIESLGISMKTFVEGVEEVKKQISK